MLSIQDIIRDLATPTLAVGTGLLYYKRLSRFNKLLFFQALGYIVADVVVARTDNNGWMYNLLIVVEMGFLLLAINTLFNSAGIRNMLWMAYGVFLLVFLVDGFSQGFTMFAYHAAIVQGLLLTGILLYVLYVEFMGKKRKYVILSGAGMVLYFACSIPFLGVMFYLHDKNAELTQQLFQYIIVLSQAIRYFFVAFAFAWQAYEQRKQKEINPI